MIWLRLLKVMVIMPPTLWLSMSASVSSLIRSQLVSIRDKRRSAVSRNSRSVITIRDMFKVLRILVLAQTLGVCAVALTACGQKGPLVHPQDPLSADRATLLQTLTPGFSNGAKSKTPQPAPAAPQAPAPQNLPASKP
jgi:predicted small lipoprotein YifL